MFDTSESHRYTATRTMALAYADTLLYVATGSESDVC